MKFKGNVKMNVERLGFYDEFGQAKLYLIFTTLCCIIKLEESIVKTPIRSSQSASTSNSEEYESVSEFLVSPDADLRLGDRVTVSEIALRVDKRSIKYDVVGKKDHIQIMCSIWV